MPESLFTITCLEAIDEPGSANDIIVWCAQVDDTLELKVFIEKEGKTEFSIEEDTSLSYEIDTKKAVELALKTSLKIHELITLWNNSYKPVKIKDDTVDFWYMNENKNEVESTLIVPWLIQQQGVETVDEFINENIIQYASSGFTKNW